MAPKMIVEEKVDNGPSNADLLESVRDNFADLDTRMNQFVESLEKTSTAMRKEIEKNSREMMETRAHLMRLQSRVDNQLMSLILANLASGVGVAAIMLAATQAF